MAPKTHICVIRPQRFSSRHISVYECMYVSCYSFTAYSSLFTGSVSRPVLMPAIRAKASAHREHGFMVGGQMSRRGVAWLPGIPSDVAASVYVWLLGHVKNMALCSNYRKKIVTVSWKTLSWHWSGLASLSFEGTVDAINSAEVVKTVNDAVKNNFRLFLRIHVMVAINFVEFRATITKIHFNKWKIIFHQTDNNWFKVCVHINPYNFATSVITLGVRCG